MPLRRIAKPDIIVYKSVDGETFHYNLFEQYRMKEKIEMKSGFVTNDREIFITVQPNRYFWIQF